MEKYGISIGELKKADRQPGQPCKKTTRSKTAGPSEVTTVSRLLKSIGKASAKLESDRLHIAALNRDIESLAAAVTEQQFRSQIKTPETSGGPPGQPPRLGSITLEAAQKQLAAKEKAKVLPKWRVHQSSLHLTGLRKQLTQLPIDAGHDGTLWLPDELMSRIMRYLAGFGMAAASVVCRRWHRLASVAPLAQRRKRFSSLAVLCESRPTLESVPMKRLSTYNSRPNYYPSKLRLLAVRPVPPFTVVTVHVGDSLLIWDTPDSARPLVDIPTIQKIGNAEITSMVWSRDGQVLFTADRGGTCRRFGVSRGCDDYEPGHIEPRVTILKEEHRWTTEGKVVVAMDVSDSRVFMATEDYSLSWFGIAVGGLEEVGCVSSWVATGQDPAMLTLPPNGIQPHRGRVLPQIAVLPDGRLAAVTGARGDTVTVYKRDTGNGLVAQALLDGGDGLTCREPWRRGNPRRNYSVRSVVCSPQGRVYVAWDVCIHEWTPVGAAFTHLRTAYTWRPAGLYWQSICVTPDTKQRTEERIYNELLWDLAPLGQRHGAKDEMDSATESDWPTRTFELEPGTLRQALLEVETNVGLSAENAVPFKLLPAHDRSTLIPVIEKQIELAWQGRTSLDLSHTVRTTSKLAFCDGHLYALTFDGDHNRGIKGASNIVVWDIDEFARPATVKIKVDDLTAALAVGPDGTIYTAAVRSEIPGMFRC